MVASIRVYSGFSKNWHLSIEPVQGIVLCLAILAMDCHLFCGGCNANMEVIGNLSIGPRRIAITCWFPLGTFKAWELVQSRELFKPSRGRPKTQTLSQTPKSKTDPNPEKTHKGKSRARGNLSFGVTFTLFDATCDDAGVYKCSYRYQTVTDSVLVNRTTQDTTQLHMFVGWLQCNMAPRVVDFDNFPQKGVTVHITCLALSTAALKWVWESKAPETGSSNSSNSSWARVEEQYIETIPPRATLRCRQHGRSVMTFPISPGDKNRRFQVYTLYEGKRRDGPRRYTLRDRGYYTSMPGPGLESDDQMLMLQQALTATAWVMFCLMLFIFIFLILAHALYPRLPRLRRAIGNSRVLRRVRDWMVDFGLLDDLTPRQRQPPPEETEQQIQQVMTLPPEGGNRRASSTLSSVPDPDEDDEFCIESLSLEASDIMGAEDSYSTGCHSPKLRLHRAVAVSSAARPTHLPLHTLAVCSNDIESTSWRLSARSQAESADCRGLSSGQLSPKTRAEPASRTGSPTGQLSPKLANSTGSPTGQLSPKLASSTGSPSGQLSPKLASSAGSPSGQLSPKLASSTGSPTGQLSPKLASSTGSHTGQLSPKTQAELASSRGSPTGQLSPKLASSTGSPTGQLFPKAQAELASSRGSPTGTGGNGVSCPFLGPSYVGDVCSSPSTTAKSSSPKTAGTKGTKASASSPTTPGGRTEHKISSPSLGQPHREDTCSPVTTTDSSVSQTRAGPPESQPESTEDIRASSLSPSRPTLRRSQRLENRRLLEEAKKHEK